MERLRSLVLGVAVAMIAATPAHAQDTPPGYKFCGWQDFENGGWTYEDPDGAYLALYARKLTCRRARRNFNRVQFPPPDYRPKLRRYRCKVLEERHEYQDARCARRDRPKIAFRWQTGA